MTENAYRGSLLLLQNKTRRDPDSYKDEFLAQLAHFTAQCRIIGSTVTGTGHAAAASGAGGKKPLADGKQRGAAGGGAAASGGLGGSGGVKDRSLINTQFIDVANYISHVSHCYPDKCEQLPDQLITILRSGKSLLSAEARLAVVKNLMLLRGKGIVQPEKSLPVFFELLLIRDKTLRHLIIHHIIGDVKKLNADGNKQAHVNKRIQSHLFAVADEDDAVQARCALLILMDLYHRNIWADDRTVEVILKGCFSKHSRIVQACLRFFLMQLPKLFSAGGGSDSESDGGDPGRAISKLKQKAKIKHMTGKRTRVMDRNIAKEKKKYDISAREEEKLARLTIDPMRFLRDPQSFAERLFAKLQRTTERFETRILFLNVLTRVIAEHEVVLLPLYTFLERYMEPTQPKVTQILALTAACVHKMIPPDSLMSLVRIIANHFVNDRSDADSITIGINTIREICKRQPLAMTPELLADLCEYKQQRGDKGVVMAARALLQLYREIQPAMLPNKLRGNQASGEEKAPLKFGALDALADIPGMELLMMERDGDDGTNGLAGGLLDEDNERELLDGLSSGDSDFDESDSDDSSKSGSWQSVSSGSEGMVDLDAAPKLVKITTKDRKAALTASALAANEAAVQQIAKKSPKQAPAALPTLSGSKRTQRDQGGNPSTVSNPGSPRVADTDDFWVDDSSDEDDDDVEAQQVQPRRKKQRPEPRKEGLQDVTEADDGSLADDEEEEVDVSSGSSSEVEIDLEDDEGDEEEESDDEAEGQEGWVEGKWTTAPENEVDFSGDDDEEFEEDSDDEDEEESDEEEEEDSDLDVDPTTGEKKEENADWYEDNASSRIAPSSQSKAGTALSNASRFSSSTAILTDEDFQRLAELRTRAAADPRLKKKMDKQMQARMKKKQALIHNTDANLLTGAVIETFTEKKRTEDRQDKIDRTIALRAASNPFNISKKRKSKTNATNHEKQKKGKLFQMTKRSSRVGAKMKRSIVERGDRRKDNKKKDVKFRIKRGWKA